MKIIYYSPHPHLNLMSSAGFGTHMREMITAFRGQGCQVLPVIMGGEDNPPEQTLEQNSTGVKDTIREIIPNKIWRTLKDVNLLKFDTLTAAPRLEEAIKQFNPDCIYERCYYMQLSGIKMAHKYDLTHVMEINSPYVDQVKFLGKSSTYLERYARHVEKKQVHGTDLPLAVVGPLRDYYSEHHDVSADKFLVTHDAFNKDNIELDPENQLEIKRANHLKDKLVVGFLGSIFEWHGLDKLIKAFDKLGKQDAKLLIVGYGAYMVELMDLTASLGREDDIIFTGHVPKEEVFDYISVMDICTAPSAAWYQSPVKIFEYGAMAKPILGPDTEAVREVMEDGKDGILVKPTVDDMKKALKEIIDSADAGKKMGQHFQQKVLHTYTWENNARRVLTSIREL